MNAKDGESHIGTLAKKMSQGDKLTGNVPHGLSDQMRQPGGYKRGSQAYTYLGKLMRQGGKS